MNTQKHNIYIVDDNAVKAGALRKFLLNRFDNKVTISLYFNGSSCLRSMHNNVQLVILNYMGKNHENTTHGVEVLKMIKNRFPKTEVIMHSSNENVAVAVDAIQSGANNYVIKKDGSSIRIYEMIDKVIAQPLRLLVAEFGVWKFCVIFLLIFILMGAAVAFTLNMTH